MKRGRFTEEQIIAVLNNHNLIYAYGCLGRFKEMLEREGLVEVPNVVIPYPYPRTHFFHEECDSEQEQLLSFCKWSIPAT
jgi:hypothetical protein